MDTLVSVRLHFPIGRVTSYNNYVPFLVDNINDKVQSSDQLVQMEPIGNSLIIICYCGHAWYIAWSSLCVCIFEHHFVFRNFGCSLISVKDQEMGSPEKAEEIEEKEENKKRHLNVVFIGHVGKLA